MQARQLSIRDLEFSYSRHSEPLYNGLSHTFEPGHLTALTGPSGRGKSTLLYIVGLLLSPSSGGVFLDGEQVSHLPDRDRSQLRAKTFGFVFQDSELDWSKSVLDNVIEPGLYSGNHKSALVERAGALLTRFGLEHRAQHTPGGISGGQAQRVALCRALINDPTVVLADEPTGNLDEDNSREVLDTLAEYAERGRSVIVATHDPRVVERADRVLEL